MEHIFCLVMNFPFGKVVVVVSQLSAPSLKLSYIWMVEKLLFLIKIPFRWCFFFIFQSWHIFLKHIGYTFLLIPCNILFLQNRNETWQNIWILILIHSNLLHFKHLAVLLAFRFSEENIILENVDIFYVIRWTNWVSMKRTTIPLFHGFTDVYSLYLTVNLLFQFLNSSVDIFAKVNRLFN